MDFKLSPGDVEEEGEEIAEEGERSTLESTWCGSNEGDGWAKVGTLETTEVENNQIGKPMVNLGRDKIAI